MSYVLKYYKKSLYKCAKLHILVTVVFVVVREQKQNPILLRIAFVFRTHEYHAQTMENVRIANKMYKEKHGVDPSVAIALDTKGPEIRTGLLEGVSTEQ